MYKYINWIVFLQSYFCIVLMSTIKEHQLQHQLQLRNQLQHQHKHQYQHQQKQHQRELQQFDHKVPVDAYHEENIQEVHFRSNLIHNNDIDINTNQNNQNPNQANNKHKKLKLCIGIIVAIFLFMLFTSHSSHQQTQFSQFEIMQNQDNFPTFQPELNHPKAVIPQQHLAMDKEINSFMQSSYHDTSKKQDTKNNMIKKDKVQARPPRCSDYLPYSVFDNPPTQYYHWYGRLRRSFETGHLYERHLAVGQKCTTQQTRQKKTVFLNMNQLSKAFNQVVFNCDLHNHDQFEYKYDGRFNQKVRGIDCSTGNKVSFSQYFIFYKRAIQNPNPSQDAYMRSTFVTLWTFYPKR